MAIAINVHGRTAARAAPLPAARAAAVQPQRLTYRERKLRYEHGLVRHIMLATAALVSAGYGLAFAISAI